MIDSEQGLAVVEVTLPEAGDVEQGVHTLLVHPDSLGGDGPVELVRVDTLMPAHGHGTDAPEIVEVEGGYEIARLNLFMPGRWEIGLGLRVGSEDDRATFSVDVR